MNLTNKHTDSAQKFVVALSGGIDSIALLHLYRKNTVRAIHINHNLSPNARTWQQFCQDFCKSLGVDLTIKSVHVGAKNIEEEARKLRYGAIYENLQPDEILLTAHHRDDQAETVLLNLCRGTGVAGLAGMPEVRKHHHRPLLTTSKTEIKEYITQHNLEYITDESNDDTHFRRNFMRLQILPALQEKYPSITKNLARVAQNSSEMLSLSEDMAKLDIETYELLNGLNDNTLRIDNLLQLAEYRIKNVVYYHVRTLGFSAPNAKVMNQILRALRSKNDAKVLILCGDWEVRIFAKNLYILPQHKELKSCALYEELRNKEGFNIKYRKHGQRITFGYKTHSQSLKKVLQEYNIPPWERESLRMYYIKEVLIAIEKIGYINK